MSGVLSVRGLSVRFGGVHALEDVDVEVEDGSLVGLIGPNGAGKTTFIDAIGGFVKHKGEIELDGKSLSGLRPHARARRGLARTWQSLELFSDLSVRENLAVAAEHRSRWATIKECLGAAPRVSPAVDDALALLGLSEQADSMPDELPQGYRKLIGVARALVARPRILCLDEPAAGLDSEESLELGRRLREVVDAGTAMLLVDHDMDLVLSICDSVVVLNFGEVIAHGPAKEVSRDPAVMAAYLGGSEGPQPLPPGSVVGDPRSGS